MKSLNGATNFYQDSVGLRLPSDGLISFSSGFHALLIFSSFLYLTRLGFSPVYVVPLFLAWAAVIMRGKLPMSAFGLCMVSVLFLCLHTLIHNFHGATVNSFLLVLGLPVLAAIQRQKTTPAMVRGARIGYVCSLMFFVVETVVRVSFPTAPSQQEFEFHANSADTWFYLYKYGSISFVDSNLTSIALLMLLGLGMCLRRIHAIKAHFLILNYVLLLLCFSRAAAVGVLISLFLGPLKNHKKIAFVAGVFALLVAYAGIENDASFGTKFVIYAGFLEAITSFSWSDILMGKGFGWFLDRFGMASHSIFVQSMIEGGLIYTLLFVVVMRFVGAFRSESSFLRFLMVLVPSLSASIYVMTFCWAVTIVYGNKMLEEERGC